MQESPGERKETEMRIYTFLLPISVLLFVLAVAGPSVSPAATGHEDHAHHHHHAHTAVREPSVDMEITPEPLKAEETKVITFRFRDDEGKPVKDLAVVHDRILHIVIAGEDLSTFAHIHPEDFGPVTEKMKSKGAFSVQYTFPKAGRYLIAVDYGIGETHFSEQFPVDIPGEPAMGPFMKDLSREKTFGDYTVKFKAGSSPIRAGEKTVLTFSISQNSKPVRDITSYLSAAMHIAVISSDLEHFVHAHGDVPGSATEADSGHMHHIVRDAYGPDIETAIVFPVRGIYRIFSEFKHQGKVVTLDFMTEVR